MTHSGAFAREFQRFPIGNETLKNKRLDSPIGKGGHFFSVLEVPDHPLSRNHHVKPKPAPKSVVAGLPTHEFELSVGVKEKSGAIRDLCETTVPGMKREEKDAKRYLTETTDQFRLDSEKARQVFEEKERRRQKMEKGELLISMAKSGYADGNKFKPTVYDAVLEHVTINFM